MTYALRCPICSNMFQAKREDARYCSDACRQKSLRRRKLLSLEAELRRIGAVNSQAQRELQKILEQHGPPAARAACRVFWLAMDTPPAPPLLAKGVTLDRVTDTTRKTTVDPVDVPIEPWILSDDDCAQMLREMSATAQYQIWLRRSGAWVTAPIRPQIERLARLGHVMIHDKRWRLSGSGMALARYIDSGGDGVASWVKSMMKHNKT